MESLISVGPAYRIRTKRLLLRCWTPEDAELLSVAIEESLDHLKPWMPWAKDEPEPLQAKTERLGRFQADFAERRDFVYGIFNPEQSKVLGGTGLHTRLGPHVREIGYWIHKDYINQGLATEATAALTKVGVLVDRVSRVEIHCDLDNARSAMIPKKLGFRRQANITVDTQGSEKMVWTISPDEYRGSPVSASYAQAFDVSGRRIL